MDLHICPPYLLLWNDWILIEGIMGFLNTHFSHSCFLVSGRQILVTLTSLCQAGSHPTCSLHLTIIWSWDAIRNILCSILCSSYLFSLHPPFWSLKSDQRMTQVHALLTSSAPDGSPVHASPLAASTVQLGCRLIFVSHYSPMISAKALTADFGLLSRQLCATLQKSEEILREIQKSELLSTVFDSLKTWAGQVKGEGSDSTFQMKRSKWMDSKHTKDTLKYLGVLIQCMKPQRPCSPGKKQCNQMDISILEILLMHKRLINYSLRL